MTTEETFIDDWKTSNNNYVELCCRIIDKLSAPKKATFNFSLMSWNLLRNAFGNLVLQDKKLVMEYVYSNRGAVSWHDKDQKFENQLRSVMDKLVGLKPRESVSEIAADFCWFFMVSLAHTWRRLIETALKMPDTIRGIVKLLRELTPVARFRARGGNGAQIILTIARCIFIDDHFDDREGESNWIRLMCALMSDELSKSVTNCDGETWISTICESAIIDPTEGMSFLLSTTLKRHWRVSINLLLSILDSGTENHIKWSGSIPNVDYDEGDSEGEIWRDSDGINASKLMATIATETAKRQMTKKDETLGWDTLRILFLVWNDEGLRFTDAAIQWLERRFEGLDWIYVCSTFCNLRNWRREIVRGPAPHCIYDFFELPILKYDRANCEQRSTKGHSKIVCSFKEFFRLGQFSASMARQILNDSNLELMATKMRDGELKEPVVEALVETLAERATLSEWRNCLELLAIFFDRLWDENQASIVDDFGLGSISVGVQMVAPLVQLSAAMDGIMSPQKSSDAVRSCVENFARILKDTAVERVHTLNNPLAKLVAWISLHQSCLKLASCKHGRLWKTGMLLLALINGAEAEKEKSKLALCCTAVKLADIIQR